MRDCPVKVTSKGQVTIPLEVREAMGIRPGESEVEFLQDENGRWYLKKSRARRTEPSRFRSAHKVAPIRMSTDEILALTRNG